MIMKITAIKKNRDEKVVVRNFLGQTRTRMEIFFLGLR